MVTLTFIAIMKNESRIIQRCLDSLKSAVDHIVISDTGSTDNTVELIKQWLKDNNIPGDVYHDEWINFGINRTLSVKNGQDWLKKNKIDLKTNYFLTIDGDMLLQVEPSFDKKKLLTNTHWQIRQKTFDMTYYNTRLMRSDLPFKAVSVTHEYWACDNPPVQDRGTLNDIWCLDIGDGGAKADKFERDIKLLTQGLIDEPKNERYLFYLAQSYDCAGNKEKGLEFYEKRVVAGGWFEEVFITFKRIGECCMELAQKLLTNLDINDPNNNEKLKQVKIYQEHAINSWLLGYEMVPSRGETLYRAINIMRMSGKNNIAMSLLKTGLKLKYPEDMLLFVEHPVYEYKFIEELSIVAHYTKQSNLGRAACDYLILYNCIPSQVRNNTFNNYFFYLDKMNWNSHAKLVNRKFEEYIASSSCLFPVANKSSFIEGVVRAVNYSINKQFQYTIRDAQGVIRTKNYWGKFNLEKPSETTYHEIAYSSNCNKPVRISHINGLEDLRVVKTLDGKMYGMAVDWEFGKNNHPSVVIVHFKKSKKDKYLIEKVVPTKYREDECQKNWVPFSMYNKLYAIYSHHPLRILEIDPDNGECKVVIEKFSQYNLEHIRGSSIPIQLEDGSWLMVVHEVIQKDTRKYVHRLLKYSKEWDLLDITYPFYFQNLFVEFSLSLFVVDKTLSIVFSTEDNSTEMVSIEMSKIDWVPRKLKTWIADNV